MAKGGGSGIGREILVARGLADWFFNFSMIPSLDKSCWNYIPAKSNAQEIAEEMVVLFANILQGGDI